MPPTPYWIDKSRQRLEELKCQIDRAWDDGRLLDPEKHPEVARLKAEYDELHAKIYGGDLLAQATRAAEQDDRLMGRIEKFLAGSPEHRALLESKTRDGRAIELEKSPEKRTKILEALKKHEGEESA